MRSRTARLSSGSRAADLSCKPLLIFAFICHKRLICSGAAELAVGYETVSEVTLRSGFFVWKYFVLKEGRRRFGNMTQSGGSHHRAFFAGEGREGRRNRKRILRVNA
jgi:hypothetical protein